MLIISMMMMMMENLHEIEFVYRIWLQEVRRWMVTNRLLLVIIMIRMTRMMTLTMMKKTVIVMV